MYECQNSDQNVVEHLTLPYFLHGVLINLIIKREKSENMAKVIIHYNF